jgi:hypothetical protein
MDIEIARGPFLSSRRRKNQDPRLPLCFRIGTTKKKRTLNVVTNYIDLA